MKYLILVIALAAVVAAPVLVSAQAELPPPQDTILSQGAPGVIDLIRTITNWMFTILLVVAVIFILLAAFKYLASEGGEEVAVAHKMLIYAAVAIAVAFLAKGIVYVVAELVTTGNSSRNGNDSLQIRYQNDNIDVGISL